MLSTAKLYIFVKIQGEKNRKFAKIQGKAKIQGENRSIFDKIQGKRLYLHIMLY
jgi:hypothetical protein